MYIHLFLQYFDAVACVVLQFAFYQKFSMVLFVKDLIQGMFIVEEICELFFIKLNFTLSLVKHCNKHLNSFACSPNGWWPSNRNTHII